MGLLNKSENWWLRLSLILFTLITLSSLSVMNRSVTQERQTLTDSLSYYKFLSDSLRNDADSLYEENFQLNHWNGVQELILDELSYKPKYKDLLKDIEKERNSNKYE
jgi:cell shape-determining protein MreC